MRSIPHDTPIFGEDGAFFSCADVVTRNSSSVKTSSAGAREPVSGNIRKGTVLIDEPKLIAMVSLQRRVP